MRDGSYDQDAAAKNTEQDPGDDRTILFPVSLGSQRQRS